MRIMFILIWFILSLSLYSMDKIIRTLDDKQIVISESFISGGAEHNENLQCKTLLHLVDSLKDIGLDKQNEPIPLKIPFNHFEKFKKILEMAQIIKDEKVRSNIIINQLLKEKPKDLFGIMQASNFLECQQILKNSLEVCRNPHYIETHFFKHAPHYQNLNENFKHWVIEQLWYEQPLWYCEKTITTPEKNLRCLELLDKEHCAFGGDNSNVYVWNMEREAYDCILKGHENWITSLAKISENELASGSFDTTIRIWNIKKNKCEQILKGHEDCIRSLVSLKNNTLASSASDGTIRIWDFKYGIPLLIIQDQKGKIKCCAEFDNQFISGFSDKSLRIWNYDGVCLQTFLYDHKVQINCVKYLPNRNIVSAGTDNVISIWDAAQGTSNRVLQGHEDWIQCVGILSKDRIISGSSDETIRVWDIEKNACNQILAVNSCVDSLAVLSQRQFISGTRDHTIRFWTCEPPKSLNLSHMLVLSLIHASKNGSNVAIIPEKFKAGYEKIDEKIRDQLYILYN